MAEEEELTGDEAAAAKAAPHVVHGLAELDNARRLGSGERERAAGKVLAAADVSIPPSAADKAAARRAAASRQAAGEPAKAAPRGRATRQEAADKTAETSEAAK